MSEFQRHYQADAQRCIDERESPPDDLHTCPKCKAPLESKHQANRTLFRCEDCHDIKPSCVHCILASHRNHPFDRIWRWAEELGFWMKQTLADVGFMVIIHEHGIMDIPVKYCKCEGSAPEAQQLIRYGCWPTTWVAPSTAMTLNVMRMYESLELQAQVNIHDFLGYLRRQTDGVAPQDVKDRYREFNTGNREFTHVLARRRAGLCPGQHAKRGDLTVMCPACPQPGINMRPGWKERDPAHRYLDALHYSIDGNFQLGLKMKNTDKDDVALSEGAGYFVNSQDFKTYLEKAPVQPAETSTCNQFDAMGTGKYKGRVSGVVALTCRHMFMLPGSIVDLLGAEKYRYVDFALVSALQDYLVLLLIMGAYDIHCQYVKNLRSRLEKTFGVVLDDLDSIVSAELPDLVAAHSLHFLPGAAMTDGEPLERIWAITNAIAHRTKEMSAGHRHDVLNAHYSDLNMYAQADAYLATAEATIDPVYLKQWKKEEAEWKNKVVDIKQHDNLDNPYEPNEEAVLSSKAIADKLNAESLISGTPERVGDVSVVANVIGLRVTQEKLRKQATEYDGTEKARTVIAGTVQKFREDVLACKEEYDVRVKSAIATALASLRAEDYPEGFPARSIDDDMTQGISLWSSKGKAVVPPKAAKAKAKRRKESVPSEDDETISLWLDVINKMDFPLPSDYHSAVRRHPAMTELVRIERSMHEGQANEALDLLRLHLSTYLSLKVRRERANNATDTRKADGRLQEQKKVTDDAKECYRATRQLLLVLGMEADDPKYQVLRDEDCKPFVLFIGEQQLGDSYRLPTWIWGNFDFVERVSVEELKKFVKDSLHTHWFRHSALKSRWGEEVASRREEMWRTWTFFTMFEGRWLARAQRWQDSECAGTRAAACRYVAR
ncbi:hypothetical protein C8Q79DRAFT_999013 [Trametes meyenii]|nr:hypothetical protein C8Q79DRAFT_999013 [Trametes meyenii]